ncbi:MAG TPA: HAMP domain-containing sensor histidine kinase [Actinophytocola sp.]|uniref:sensor histidine kinase n=1 Tax=Actinophytocola sp. TaxID=1872138 RepID=UPI002DDD98BF|nr:HAMP domain-containing sensor histidine kinase [Actinophytocola sp.]HEV2778742.1 HAMP domain-containing sensor histidine kinase [Actinophytocola sp.]
MTTLTRWAEERRQRFSLRTRVAVLAAVCVAGAVALVSIGAYVTVRQSLYQQVDDNLAVRAENVLRNPDIAATSDRSFPAALLSLTDVEFAVINGAGDNLIDLGQREPPVGVDEVRVARGLMRDHIRTDSPTDRRVYAVRYGNGALVIAQPLGPTRDLLENLAVVLVVIGAAGIVLAALAGTAVARGSLRPVLRLTRATERVARTGDLRPIPVSGDDELARLTQSFNTMLGAVAEAQEHQRRLVADAGHELRTPLTSLRTNLELLLAAEAPNAPSLSEQDKAEIHRDLRAQLDELTTLIGDLVELAREDAEQTTWEPVELNEVVEQALDRARRRAGDVHFDVQVRPWRLIGDGPALERAVLNLLDNAIKFSPPGGTVRVRLGATGDGFAVLEVADQGPGIADEDLPRVFDRFYRSQEARTLPGSGLGLAIVKQAAVRHGGQVLAGRAPDGGALFTMWLPGSPE